MGKRCSSTGRWTGWACCGNEEAVWIDGRWWADIESMPGVMAYGCVRYRRLKSQLNSVSTTLNNRHVTIGK